jgi:type VI protein secretion system component Hcp
MFVVVSATVSVDRAAEAGPIYIIIPSIAGEDPIPGYPGAISVNPLEISHDSFSITKMIDKATPKIQMALVGGTPLGTVAALFYNTSPSGPPDAVLPFANVLASSQTIGLGTTETDTFAATTPDSIYLSVSGIVGGSSTPGFTGLMKIDSLELSGNTFSVNRVTDSATPQIVSAVALGSHHSASLLFYNSSPAGPPDAEIDFQDVIASAFTPISSGDTPTERDTFNFARLSQPTPEPQSVLLAAVGMALVALRYFRRRRGR